ncbi:uncharacterized protein B0I36DRAFT_348292 [Microdochium trichocladiopsis]|uniref:Uncharacterized protein n=1 Tax=Microdochium trichocladiopsis TaxID=1682393 RepID=A0A9P8Y9E6_9PEZI|nr:uncharacterized protein B0I36DRAFT_348292 [Microdochium trichocladiopsis]KAH7033200.1 hypothetical protein B0I36DRAFT_348292 [Microdochium trichocladiopsis]
MEGYLTIPPDRGTILGRALWKTRYVVIGGPQRDSTPHNGDRPVRAKDASARTLKEKPSVLADQASGTFLSIYKNKDDTEPVQQYSLASISECHVQLLAHRKQGPILPTLAIWISPDPAADKLRKRRSSRTAGLTSSKETGPTTLWFRVCPDEQTLALSDWSRYIQSLIQPTIPDRHPISPISPTSPSFINPFSPATRSSMHARPAGSARPAHTSYSSESPSLRSRRSDISSSHNSSSTQNASSANDYTPVYPNDIPSPAMTVPDYPDEFIEGWTSAQGRSSTLGSPIRVRGSMGPSQVTMPVGADSSSPPGARETILDRAFSMRYIPGADTAIPGEEKLSSLARFDALMREAEERRGSQQRESAAIKEPARSNWDDESDADSMAGDQIAEEDSDGDNFAQDMDQTPYSPVVPPSKVPAYANHRHSLNHASRARHISRSSLSFHEAQLAETPSILRPHTAQPKNRPPMSPRSSTQTSIPGSPLHATVPNHATPRGNEDRMVKPHSEVRETSTSVKRLSLNDFPKRLSSSSSLLIVQTNVSASSNSTYGDHELESQAISPRTNVQSRGTPTERDSNCGWRGSRVFGNNEGGYL